MNQLRRLVFVGMIAGAAVACTGTLGDNGPSGKSSTGSGGTPGAGAGGGGTTATGGAGGNGGAGATTGTGGSSGGASGAGGNGGVGTGGSAGGAGGAAGAGGTAGASGAGGAGGSGGGFSTPASAFAAARKIKGVLTGLGPTDAEVLSIKDPAGLKSAVDTWMATPQFQDKMILFLQNAFQQSSLAVLDFEFQLRKRPGAFDLSYAIFGDDAFPMLFKNMKESFARTALQLVAEGRPFTDILTAQRFMMTTALKSVYMQTEMPYDIHTMSFQFNHGSRPAIEDSLDPSSANYLVFGYQAPTTSTGRIFTGTCAGDATKVSAYPGNTYLFHILLGSVPRDSTNNGAGTTNLGCMEHAMKPYFTAQDLSDWQMVTITNTGTPIRSFDLPALRTATTLPSKLPRVSFFSTPAFLAVWNTNDSNQHRVTANQALLAALGQGYTNSQTAIPTPPSSIGLDGTHSVTGTECYACHKSLDPMRQFWANSFDYNDQINAKSTSMAASFGFGDVVQNGTSLVDFGRFAGQVTDSQVAGQTVNRFALATTQKLCFFANSAKCEETDPEMRRVALVFQNANYDFKALVRELMSSPLVTAFAKTATFDANGVTISVTRRAQLCAALSNRLGKADLCEIVMPTPTDVTTPLNRLAGALPADTFSRGSELPVTSSDPNLFYRAASELVCEAVAAKVVDGAASTSVYASSDAQNAIVDMVPKVMGVPSSDGHYTGALQALRDHYAAAIAAKATPTNALRSTFSAACQSPTSLALGI